MLAYTNRFHGHSSLRYVFKNGETIRSRAITVRVTQNRHRSASRFSVSISKKVLKSAVRRNRVRRRIYEVVRLALPDIEGVHDVVLIVTSAELVMCDAPAVREAVLGILSDARLIADPST